MPLYTSDDVMTLHGYITLQHDDNIILQHNDIIITLFFGAADIVTRRNMQAQIQQAEKMLPRR